jgi:hypothetical protein
MGTKERYHPNAYLARRRNVTKGLKARTKILAVMDRTDELTLKEVSRLALLSYSSSLHHVRLLEGEGILKRAGKRPYKWRITGKGQKSLNRLN